MGVSVPRYYALEGQALEGLLKACEPRPKGPRRTLEREIRELNAEIERLERESARNLALLRATRRTVGLPAAERAPEKKAPKGGKKPKKRKPVARALRASKLLQKAEAKQVGRSLRYDQMANMNGIERPAEHTETHAFQAEVVSLTQLGASARDSG